MDKPCKFDGLYRCTEIGCTRFADEGTIIPQCPCGAIWLYHPRDNRHGNEMTRIYLNALEMIEVRKVPVVNQGINLVGGINNHKGAYLVTRVFEKKGIAGIHPCIRAESVGDFDPDLLAFKVITVAV